VKSPEVNRAVPANLILSAIKLLSFKSIEDKIIRTDIKKRSSIRQSRLSIWSEYHSYLIATGINSLRALRTQKKLFNVVPNVCKQNKNRDDVISTLTCDSQRSRIVE